MYEYRVAAAGPHRCGTRPEPSAGILDSQTIKTTAAGGERGYDGGKLVIVHAASMAHTEGAVDVGAKRRGRVPRLMYADQSYRQTMIDWCQRMLHCTVQIVARPTESGFHVLPQRWKVERTFGWFNWSRLLSKEYDVYVEVRE